MVAAPTIERMQAQSVVEHPDPERGTLRFGTSKRGPLLPPPGTRERQWKLRQYWRHDYNELFKGAGAGLIKRVQSTPWEVRGPDAERWQAALMNADFGDWDGFVSKIVKDFLRYDSGAWIELIGPGNPREGLAGPLTGLAALDSLRCYPTGNPVYPCIYYDRNNKMHLMHRGRAVQFVDTPDSEEILGGYGESALSRGIATVHREIIMNRYIDQFLDDKPPPGMAVFGNISKEQVEEAIRRSVQDREVDFGGEWGHTVLLYGLEAENEPTVTFITYTKAPEKFDYKLYTEINVKKVALAMGTDVTEIWELTQTAIGSATQTEIMAQKSRGKALGRVLKGLERTINRALPPDVEFRFQYRDPQEDREEAEKAQTWATVVNALVAQGTISDEEGRQILTNQVPAMQDALTDLEGRIRRLPDADPKPADEGGKVEPPPEPVVTDDQTPREGGNGRGRKEFAQTATDFELAFADFVRAAERGRFRGGVLRSVFREELYEAGTRAYYDGLEDGGLDPDAADALTRAGRRRTIAEWLAMQNMFIVRFVTDVTGRDVSAAEIERRGEMWVNKSLRAIYYAGLHEASKDRLYKWKLGPTKEHCATCAELHNQVHSLATWMKAGFMPGCTCLECGGYNCLCRFSVTDERAQGRLPGRGIVRTVVDQVADFIRRVGAKSLEAPMPDIVPATPGSDFERWYVRHVARRVA